jgi:hypothetical protein
MRALFDRRKTMGDDKLEHVLRTVDAGKRSFLRKLITGASFAVPIVASYSAKDLAYAQVGSPTTCTNTDTITTIQPGSTITLTVTQVTTTSTFTTTTITTTT